MRGQNRSFERLRQQEILHCVHDGVRANHRHRGGGTGCFDCIKAHLFAGSPVASDPRPRCSQPGDQRQDFHDHLLWHPNLGHLEHDVAAVADDLRAELDQLLAQTRPKSPPYPGNGGLYLSRERPVSALSGSRCLHGVSGFSPLRTFAAVDRGVSQCPVPAVGRVQSELPRPVPGAVNCPRNPMPCFPTETAAQDQRGRRGRLGYKGRTDRATSSRIRYSRPKAPEFAAA